MQFFNSVKNANNTIPHAESGLATAPSAAGSTISAFRGRNKSMMNQRTSDREAMKASAVVETLASLNVQAKEN